MATPLHLLPLLLLAVCGAASAAPPSSDIAANHAGDIHSGWAKIEAFSLATDYGEMTLPRAHLARIEFDGEQASITTRHGGRLRGTLAAADIPFERVDGPLITLHLSDLASLEFAPQHPVSEPPRRWLELSGGDRLRVALPTAKLRLDGQTLTLGEADRLQVHDGDDGLIGRLNHRQGSLESGAVTVRTAWGAPLELPLNRIERLTPEGESLALSTPTGTTLCDALRGGGVGPEMVILPAARYRRGDLAGDGDTDEHPTAWIELSRPFAIGRHEVTFDDYDRYAHDTGVERPDDSEWGRGLRPVVNVSWREANAYAEWLSRKSGRRYRLPSEAEWEYAARGGAGSRYWWGESAQADPEEGARAVCAGCGSLWDGQRSAPSGSFPANPFGLFDTAGNVWEWAADCYEKSYQGAPTDGRPLTGTNCGKRVIRGGGWSFPPEESRSASRWRDFATRRSDDTGFRLVRELSDEEIRSLERSDD